MAHRRCSGREREEGGGVGGRERERHRSRQRTADVLSSDYFTPASNSFLHHTFALILPFLLSLPFFFLPPFTHVIATVINVNFAEV